MAKLILVYIKLSLDICGQAFEGFEPNMLTD